MKKIIHYILLRLALIFCKVLYSTYKIEIIGLDNVKKAQELSPTKSCLFACWHESSVNAMFCYFYSKLPTTLVMASRSKDGDFAAFVSSHFAMLPVRGSSKKKNVEKGGKEAVLEYIKKINQGMMGSITVDGPKGPRRVCKPGIVVIAQQTGAPIIPVAPIPSSYFEVNSWDRFKLAKPFSKITFYLGEALFVDKTSDTDKIQQYLDELRINMNKLDNEFKPKESA